MAVLKRSKLFEQISERLERRIRDNELEPGSELPSERVLMQEFGCGRTAVREALFHLQRMGLVELRAGTRAKVAAPSAQAVMHSLSGSARYLLAAPDGMRHFQDARRFFETGLARDAARLANAEDLSRLKDALDANEAAIGDMKRFERTDVAFHLAIAVIPRNPIYEALHAAIIEWLIDQRHVTLSYPGQNRVAFEAHKSIFDAISRQDGEGAARLMHEHLDQVAKLYWEVREACT